MNWHFSHEWNKYFSLQEFHVQILEFVKLNIFFFPNNNDDQVHLSLKDPFTSTSFWIQDVFARIIQSIFQENMYFVSHS